ncbi:MAG: tetratricopeptide repeat protein [Pyrinomonadaceae bacterium]
MRVVSRSVHFYVIILASAGWAVGQVEGIRQATGMPMSNERMVYGRVNLEGLEPGEIPSVTVKLLSPRLQSARTTIDREGYYYFKELTVSGGTVIVEVNGTEVARQTALSVGPLQQRLDFFVKVPSTNTLARPGTVDARYAYERSKENRELFEKAVEFIEHDKPARAVPLLKKVVTSDPNDYAAWTILGAAYTAASDLVNAEAAYRSALAVNPSSVPTLTSLGRLYLKLEKFGSAVEVLEKAVAGDPNLAIAFRLLGEAYLLIKLGSKGIPALTEALRLDPVGMADSHLLLARLYHVVGARHLASLEYKQFLEKVPDHPEKKKMQDYIKKNPIEDGRQDNRQP